MEERVPPQMRNESDRKLEEDLKQKEMELQQLLDEAKAENTNQPSTTDEDLFVTETYLNLVVGPLKEQISLLMSKNEKLEAKNKELTERLAANDKLMRLILDKLNLNVK